MKRTSIQRSALNRFCVILSVIPALLSANESRVFFFGNEAVSNAKIDGLFVSGTPEEGAAKLLNLYLESGYPYAEIALDSAVVRGNTSFYYFEIRENGRYVISGIKNRSAVKNSFLEGALNLRGKQFSSSLVESKLSGLSKFLFIEENSSYKLVPSSETSVEIVTEIGQRRSSSVAGALASDLDSFNLIGYLNLSLLSPFGYGDSYKLDYRRISRDNTDISGGGEFPFILGSQLGVFFEGEYASIDSSLASGIITAGMFAVIGSFKVKTGAGRSASFAFDSTAEGTESSHIYGELSYHNSLGRSAALSARTVISGELSSVADGDAEWETPAGFLLLGSLFSCHFSFAETYRREFGEFLGGNSNLKSYPEEFILASDYAFIEESFSYGNFRSFRPGIFFDGALYRQNKEEKMESFLMSYGAVAEFEARDVSLKLYYALNPETSILDGRVHAMLSYSF